MKHLFKYIFFFTIASFSIACSSDREDEIENTPNPVKIVFYKNADELAATYDTNSTVNQTIRNQAYDLYKLGKWKELEALFKANNLNGGWPPANGGFNIVDEVPILADKNMTDIVEPSTTAGAEILL